LTLLTAAAAKSYIPKMTSSLIATHVQEINTSAFRGPFRHLVVGRGVGWDGLIHSLAFFLREHSMKCVTVKFRNFVSSSKFPKMLVNNCQFMLLKNTEKQRPHRHHGRSLKSRIGLHYIYIYIYIYIYKPVNHSSERKKDSSIYLRFA
jgi:hypothetical protein